MPCAIFLCLGSNLGDSKSNLMTALRKLEQHGVRIVKRSSFYRTEPVERIDQPDFLNLVCEVKTELHAEELLRTCLAVEGEMGRVRDQEKGPRNIDIDILFYGQQVLELPHLKIPHPRLDRRNFVLIPLEEIAPDFKDPVSGRSIDHLRRDCPDCARVDEIK